MEHCLEMMSLPVSCAIDGDRVVLLLDTKGESPAHLDSQIDTPHTCAHWLGPDDIR